MDALLEHLREVIEQTRGRVSANLDRGAILGVADDDLLEALALAAELQRLTDAVLVEATGEVSRRSHQRERDLRLTSRQGCHDVSELVQRITRLSGASVGRLQRAAKPVMVRESLDGTALDAPLPAMRAALIDGVVGVDGLLAVAGPLDGIDRRVGWDDVWAADAVLAATARGEGPDGAPPTTADMLRVHAQVWATMLDQDGAEPAEAHALRTRGIVFSAARDGVVPFHGALLPEVFAQLKRICDAVSSPRVRGSAGPSFRPDAECDVDAPADPRTLAQKQHDALATALMVAAASETLPTIGGAAPTLVVSVRERDLTSDSGWAHIDGVDQPIGVSSAAHVACSGVLQRVLLGEDGRITRIGTEERVFNRHQRRAIALRDGGCIIPGCGVPAAWCEIHHVIDHALGGPTHTDNGVLLCWFHHRSLNTGGWTIRIRDGVPEVRAPEWIEARPRWRPSTTSRTRMLDLVGRRT